MELYDVNRDTYTFRITGNTRHKILNEIHKNDIYFKHGEMYMNATNPNNFTITYNKCGILFKYTGKPDSKPIIECLWEDYIPFYITQPNKIINLNILQEFGIDPTSYLYKNLLNINIDEYVKQISDYNQNLDKEQMSVYNNDITYIKKISYPSFIIKHDKPIYINNNVSDAYSDYEDYMSESNGFTDTYTSDD